MEKFVRNLSKSIQKRLARPEIIMIYGARQVGKTTLTHYLTRDISPDHISYVNGDSIWEHDLIDFTHGKSMIPLIKDKKIIIIDEAQKIPNIGNNLKLLYDSTIPIKIIVTWSSSIDIAHAVSEPLTGRMIDFTLYPLWLDEVHQQFDLVQLSKNLNEYMMYGLYPAIVTEDLWFKQDKLKTIANNYLYKDILQIEGIKKPDILMKLLKLLALQIGNQVSYHELATKLQIHQATVIKYIELLEKTFVIYRLHARSANVRNEITKSVKIYFWDCGIRNTIIQDRNIIDNRSDAWHLRENFIITERIKYRHSLWQDAKFYFWRNYQQQEIDLIEEYNGELYFREVKQYNKKPIKLPSTIAERYPDTKLIVIHRDNYWEHVISNDG